MSLQNERFVLEAFDQLGGLVGLVAAVLPPAVLVWRQNVMLPSAET